MHVDMDAFYASVEMRDKPYLRGKPLVIGAMPDQRGVVATCNYEARKYGIHSAMNIKEAYRLCPNAVFLHPDMEKYRRESQILHEIWASYTDIIEYVALDEGYMDLTERVSQGDNPKILALDLKRVIKSERGLNSSVGLGYSMGTAKFASEERKPNGFFMVRDRDHFTSLIIDRDVSVIHGCGRKTREKLSSMGIEKVRDLLEKEDLVKAIFGKRGIDMVDFARGIDKRVIRPYYESESKSIGREETFQDDRDDYGQMREVLKDFSRQVAARAKKEGIYCQTVTLKVTYSDMKKITRSKSIEATRDWEEIFAVLDQLFSKLKRDKIRLIGVSISNFTKEAYRQLSMEDMREDSPFQKDKKTSKLMEDLNDKYGPGSIKRGGDLIE